MCSTAGSAGLSSSTPTTEASTFRCRRGFSSRGSLRTTASGCSLCGRRSGQARSRSTSSCAVRSAPGRLRPQPETQCRDARAASRRRPTAAPVAPPRRSGEPDGQFAGSPVDPRYTFETLLRGRGQPRRLRRRAGGRRGRLAVEPLQSALHPRRRRPRQDAPPPCHHARRAARRSGPEGGLPDRRALHVPLRGGAPQPVGDPVQGERSATSTSCSSTTCSSCKGKSVQQEFCHMLNALIDGARQVVVAADRPPAELETLDERVRSRLKGGVAFEIGAPDLDLRRRILATRYRSAQRAESRPRHSRAGARIRRPVGGLQRPRPRRRAQPPGRPVAVHQPDR